MATTSKPQLNEIFVVRTLAILAVLVVHSTSVTVVTLPPESIEYSFYNAVNTFFRFGTPTFILLSSLVLFYSYYHRPLSRKLIGRFYSNRLMYILLPYFIFSLIYNGIKSDYYQQYDSFAEFFNVFSNQLLLGSAYTHLYFVFISIQLYLFFPLMLFVLKRWPELTKHLIWIGFVIQWAYVLLNNLVIKYENTGSISLSYMSFYLTGAFIGIYYLEIKKWITSRQWVVAVVGAAWLVAVSIHIYMWQLTRVSGIEFDSKLYTLAWNIHTILTAILLIYVSVVITNKAQAWILTLFMKIGYLSFGIYLIHPLYLFYYRMFVDPGDNMTLYHLFIAGSFIGALLVSALVVHLILYKWKWGWVIFGAKPKTGKEKKKNQVQKV